jgi:hypothetical protein
VGSGRHRINTAAAGSWLNDPSVQTRPYGCRKTRTPEFWCTSRYASATIVCANISGIDTVSFVIHPLVIVKGLPAPAALRIRNNKGSDQAAGQGTKEQQEQRYDQPWRHCFGLSIVPARSATTFGRRVV